MSAPQATNVRKNVPAASVDLSVVVPAHNEEQRLGPTLEAIVGYLGDNGSRFGPWEVLVVDDGSTDGTRDVVTAVAARERRVRLVTSAENQGKGHALRLGVLASRGRRVLVTDADLATRSRSWRRWTRRWPTGPRRRSAHARLRARP